MIPLFPYYPKDNDGWQAYSEYERDTHYFTHTLQALKHWDRHRESGGMDKPVIPETSSPNMASRDVKQFFDTRYKPEKPLSCERFVEAADLLERIVKTNGIEGMYSFFRVLSHEDDGSGRIRRDEVHFKKILSDVFVPHFEPHPAAEILHALATLGHVAIAPVTGMVASAIHAPVAAYSVARFRKLRNDRLERRETPPLEVIDNVLPLLQSMHTIAQHSVDVLNAIEPIKGRPFPDVAPIDITFLQTALERVRHGDDLSEAHDCNGR